MTMKIYRRANGSETWDKNGVCKSVEAPYYVVGATDKTSAVQAVIEQAEQSLNGIALKEFRVSEFDADKNLEVTAIYEKSSESSGSEEEEMEPTVSYSGGGGTRTATSGELIKSAAPAGKTAPAPGNFVNWNGKRGRDFAVLGVQVPTASPRLTYTKIMRASEANSATWQIKLEKLVGCVNLNKWRGREAGTVLFNNFSFSGKASGNDLVAVSFEFLIRPNEKDAKLGDVGLGDVNGWDYTWTITEPTPEGPPEVRGAYVSRVLNYVNFSEIGV